MRNLDRNFNKTKNLAIGVFVFNAIVIIGVLIIGIIILHNVVTNPAGVGEFFGKIVSGFQSVNK